jgi:DNA end-binding protein Ku
MAAKAKVKARPVPRTWANVTLQLGGFVTIPVSIRPSTSDTRSSTGGRTLCAEHKHPVTQLWECEFEQVDEETGEVTDDRHLMKKSDTVIGYETAKSSGEFVILNDDELDSLVAERETAAAVQRVVSVAGIDPIFYEKQYTMWPQEGGEQPYDLFATALRESGEAAIVTATLGKKTRTYAIRWSEAMGCLVAGLLHFESDVRLEDGDMVSAGMDDRKGAITPEHLALAHQILSGLEGEFDSNEVEDTYAAALREMIDAAAKGETITVASKKPEAKKGGNLMDALKASVEASQPGKKPAAKTPARKPAAKKTPVKA